MQRSPQIQDEPTHGQGGKHLLHSEVEPGSVIAKLKTWLTDFQKPGQTNMWMFRKFKYHLSIMFRLFEFGISRSGFKQCQLHHEGGQTAHQSVRRTPVESDWMRCALLYIRVVCLQTVVASMSWNRKRTSKVVSAIPSFDKRTNIEAKHLRPTSPQALPWLWGRKMRHGSETHCFAILNSCKT